MTAEYPRLDPGALEAFVRSVRDRVQRYVNYSRRRDPLHPSRRIDKEISDAKKLRSAAGVLQSRLSKPIDYRPAELVWSLYPNQVRRDKNPSILPGEQSIVRAKKVASYLEALADRLDADRTRELDAIETFLRDTGQGYEKLLVLGLMVEWCSLTATAMAEVSIGNESTPSPLVSFLIAACTPVEGDPARRGLGDRNLRRLATERRDRAADRPRRLNKRRGAKPS